MPCNNRTRFATEQRLMRIQILSMTVVLMAAFTVANAVVADDSSKQQEPTAEQLGAAKTAFATLGGSYDYRTAEVLPSEKFHYFSLPLARMTQM